MKWAYLNLSIEAENLDGALLSAGDEGWELVSVVPIWEWRVEEKVGYAFSYPTYISTWRCVLKRPRGDSTLREAIVEAERGKKRFRKMRDVYHQEPSG